MKDNAQPARWYMIDKDGMATLCTDREDAEKEAKNANMAWPHTAPHRAVQLVEVADVEALRTGYAAARLEIESLQARIKTMAEEHADELMVAHLDGRMRAAQPAVAQHPAQAQTMTEPTDAEIVAFAVENGMHVRTGRGAVKFARAVLAKWGAQPVPAGYALVPVEPTPEMLSAMWAPPNSSLADTYSSLSDAYNAMLAAAPQPVAREPLTDEQIRAMCKQPWIFDTAKQWVRITERAHGIKGGQHGTE